MLSLNATPFSRAGVRNCITCEKRKQPDGTDKYFVQVTGLAGITAFMKSTIDLRSVPSAAENTAILAQNESKVVTGQRLGGGR